MELKQEWLPALKAWAQANDCVRELWLHGSRIKGNSRVDSDLDVAVVLMPPTNNTNWAFARYVEVKEEWRAELSAIVGLRISLSAISAGTPLDGTVRSTGKRIWCRGEAT